MSAPRPRVLFVGAFPPDHRKVFGGMVTSCRALLRSSLPQSLDLDLLDSTQASHPPPGLHMRLILAAKRCGEYLVRFSRHRPDAVLLFTAIGASVVEKGAMAWYSRIRGVPALMFPRGGSLIEACRRSTLTRLWIRFAFGGARVILCQGPVWHAFACEVLGYRPEDAPIVPNWTATDEFLAVGRARAPRAGDKLRLLFVGWLDQEKGVGELLSACRDLVADHRFELMLVGEGNMDGAARQYVQANGLADVVSFKGWLEGEDLRAAYAAADVFVLPSWGEGLPNAMIEAMATKLAVVVSSVGNIPGVVADGLSALLVPPQDAAALKAALTRVMLDAPLRHGIAAAGFAIAEERFGLKAAAERILASVVHAMRRPGTAVAERST